MNTSYFILQINNVNDTMNHRCIVRWGNDEKTIILIELFDNWNWLDLEIAAEDYLALMNTVKHSVHLIFHPVDNKFRIPANALGRIPKLMELTHPRENQTVIVGYALVLKNVLGIIKRVYSFNELVDKYHFANTLEAAYALLEQYDMVQEQQV